MQIQKVYLKGQEQAKGHNNPKYIIVHHPEVKSPCSIERLNDIMRNMDFYMIGYNFYVRRDGSVYEGRPVWATGANCYNYNTCSIGVCFEGDFTYEHMPEAQYKAGVELINYLANKYNIPKVRVSNQNSVPSRGGIGGHKNFYSTACPGANFPLERMMSEVMSGTSSAPSVQPSAPSANSGEKSEFLKSCNALARVALDPRSTPSEDYTDLGEIYAGESIRILPEICDKKNYLPVKYWRDGAGKESDKVWVNAKQSVLKINTNATVVNVVTELDARYNPAPDSSRMGYIENGERVLVHKVQGDYALATYYASNGHKTAWFTAKYLKLD